MIYTIKRIPLIAAMLFALNNPQAQAVPGDSDGSELAVTTISGNQSEPRIAMAAEGDFVITWHSNTQDNGGFGVYAQRYTADGTPAGDELRVNTTSPATQRNPSIAMDADGDFVIAWDSTQDGIPNIYAQRYNADSSAVGGEFPVNRFTLGSQSNPGIAMDADGDFVIVWNSFGQDNSGFGVYAQRYNANGSAAGAEFRVNTSTTGPQQAPSIAMDAAGNFIITWESSLTANVVDDDFDIYAQRYNADGSAAGAEFSVNTATTGTQSSPSIALDVDGDFVIAWHSDIMDNGDSDIYVRRYNANGSDADAGVEVKVNTVTTGEQASPSIAMDADGDFVITWRSNNQDQDTNGFGVYARRYNADGNAVDMVEFIVNTFIIGNQEAASIAMDADDDFVITWHSDGQDGTDNVYAQRYLGTDKKTIDLSLVVQDDTDPVTAGNNFVYTLITTNNGNGIALNVNLNDPLPIGLTYVSDDSNCVLTSATLVCHIPFMNPGDMSTINVTMTATTAGTLNNIVTVSVAQTDTNTVDNTDTESTLVNAAPPGSTPEPAPEPAPGTSTGTADEDLSTGSLGVISLLLVLPLWLRRRWLE